MDAFTISKYSGSNFNLVDFYNYMNTYQIKIFAQWEKCSYFDFLLQIDNRMSNFSFLGGVIAKITAELIQYLAFSKDTSLTTNLILGWNALYGGDWPTLGKQGQMLLSRLVNYYAPSVRDIIYNKY